MPVEIAIWRFDGGVKRDKLSREITSDPNRSDDPEYIVRLVGRVARVSVETVRIVEGLPDKAW